MAIDKLTSQGLAPGAVTVNSIDDNSVTAAKLHTTAVQDKLGYTPVSPTELANKADSSSLGTLATVSPTGTPDSTKFLRGDNSWQVVAITPTAVSDQSNISTGYFDLPSGTTVQRPASPSNGMIRKNNTTSKLEFYDEISASWIGLGNSVPTNGLKLWWNFDETGNTVIDISGNNNNGTINGSAPRVSGIVGSAIEITSESQSVTSTYVAPINAKSMCFWIKSSRNLSDVDAQRIGFQGNNNGNGFMWMYGVGSVQDLGFWGYGAANDWAIGTNMTNKWSSTGDWVHVAATSTGTIGYVYINGVLQTQYYNGSVTQSFMSLYSTLGTTFNISCSSGTHTAAVFDQVLVYDRVLSELEINAIKNATSQG
jgi:hypothetical protein